MRLARVPAVLLAVFSLLVAPRAAQTQQVAKVPRVGSVCY
jgi:hypothetical protein